jgi:hypothetical protein
LSAIYDEDFILIDDFKQIAKNYATSWFIIDLVSVIPFDLILMTNSMNRVTRFSRIGKLYRMIRLAKMVRILKVVHVRSNIIKNLSEKL